MTSLTERFTTFELINNSYLDKNTGSHQREAAGILSGCFLADIG